MTVRGSKGLGIGGHHRPYRGETDDWLTPPFIIDALGPFDLDPCAALNQPWATASRHYTITDDGLSQKWQGFVFVNPPYGPQTGKWLEKLTDHGNGIALTFARTETAMFFDTVWSRADCIFFLKGRLFFYRLDGQRASHNSGGPSVLVGYGKRASKRIMESGLSGAFVSQWSSKL